MGKKKIKTSLSFPNHVGNHHYSKGAKKSNRINGGKLNGPSATATRPAETEPATTYGVVPSEYNIQAQINWLTAPPSSNDKKNSSNNLPQPGPSKKPQRGYHKDVCDGCGEGECLMYCDKCPAAFHAICDDPPLPPEDFEAIGLTWKCKKCRNMVAIKTEDSEDATDTSRYTNGGPINQFFHQTLPHFHTQNPSQFKLPKEMPAYDYPFPGTSRHLLKTCRPRTTVIDVENGIVPRPIALCFHCQKSCRIGALIQCDKCDSFFHLDCVDPPLTTIPTSVWICPLHVEPYLESTQLTSVALSERVKIWENGDRPVNRSAVILDFLRKTSRRNPMFRRKKPIRMVVNHDSVPDMVRNSYREDIVSLNERFGGLHMLASICDMESFSRNMQEQVSNHRKGWNELYLPVGLKLAEDKAKLDMIQRRNGSKMEILAQMLKLYNTDEAEETQTQPKEAVAGQQDDPSKNNTPTEQWIREELKTMFMDLTRDKTKVCQIKDDLKDISHKIYGPSEQAPDPTPMPEQVQGVSINTLPSEKRTTSGRDGSTVQDKVNQMKYLPKKTLRKLAACHLRYMQRRKEIRERAKLKNKDRYLALSKPPPKSVLSLYVENVGVTVEMTSQSFWIGSSDSCDWKITDLVKCNRIQRKHAKMFFNPVESCWEILNYSPNGIYVNNTWFGFKGSGATPTTNVTSERYQEIQERNTRRVDEYIENSNGELQGKDASPCYCKPFPVRAMSNVLEGSAKIHVGNKLQIGCAKIQVQGFISSLL